MLALLLVAIVYFYFNWQYFRLVKRIMGMPRPHMGFILFSFLINYLFFCYCSIQEFSLLFNWFWFAVLLYAETFICSRGDKLRALFCTLLGITFCLAVNIFCRSVIAVLLNQSLYRFNNNLAGGSNLKGIPLFWGFLIAGAVMQCLSCPSVLERLRLIMKHPRHQSFLLQIMFGLLCYLFLNLLLYSTPLNDVLLKIWSIKSCIFGICGLYIAIRYTRRICELEDYREKNRMMEKELEQRYQEEEKLRRKMFLDEMTGFYNRRYAEEKMDSMLENKQRFLLCFLDLDGLKKVNDLYGHEEGDRYIRTVTEQIQCACRSGGSLLFRYGGDEFLILFSEMTLEKAEEKIREIRERLRSVMARQDFLYPLSFSYGLVESDAFTEGKELVETADHRMYEQKRQKKAEREAAKQTMP